MRLTFSSRIGIRLPTLREYEVGSREHRRRVRLLPDRTLPPEATLCPDRTRRDHSGFALSHEIDTRTRAECSTVGNAEKYNFVPA